MNQKLSQRFLQTIISITSGKRNGLSNDEFSNFVKRLTDIGYSRDEIGLLVFSYGCGAVMATSFSEEEIRMAFEQTFEKLKEIRKLDKETERQEEEQSISFDPKDKKEMN